MMASKTVAIIGAGISGLSSIKACLEEGLEPVCYEQQADIGGTWTFTEELGPNQGAAVYSNLCTNDSKCMMNFSDFPFDKNDSIFLGQSRMKEYLLQYAQHFGLLKYIQFNTKVEGYSQTRTYCTDGTWAVNVRPLATPGGAVKCRVFDGVIVCGGINYHPWTPEIAGRESSKLTTSHAISFRRPEAFVGKRVLVIGNGVTAGDIACDLSRSAQKVYLSIGDGSWVISHTYKGGFPWDVLTRRFMKLSPTITNEFFRLTEELEQYDYNMNPRKGPLEGAFMINSEIGFQISQGALKIIPRVVEMRETSVVLSDKQVLNDVDHVLYATGYLKNDMFKDPLEMAGLYKMIFPIKNEKATLAMVGTVVGVATPVIYELQSRLAARVLAGKVELPSKVEMQRDQKRLEAMVIKQTQASGTIWVFAMTYCDALAEELGAYPSFWKLILRNPRLAFQCYFGYNWPYQYRLLGPHAWDGAEQACFDAYDNTLAGMKPIKQQGSITLRILFGVLIAAIALLYTLFR